MEASKIKEIIQKTTKSRLGFEMRWYVVDRFLDGVHFDRVVKMNPDGSYSLEKFEFVRGIKPIPIPRAEKQLDSVLNILFFNKPVWKVYALDVEAAQFADKLNDVFDALWETLQMKKKIKTATFYALKYSVGYLEVGIDYGGNLFIEAYSPWNIYHDIGIEQLEQTRFLIKVIKKTIADLKENPEYNPEVLEELKPENKEGESEYYEQRFKEKFTSQISLEDREKDFVLIKEVWFREGSKWFMGTECQGKWLREPREVPYFPFVALNFTKNQIYSTSWIEKLIPLNREIDLLSAYIKNFIYSTAQGKLLEPKGSKIERILDKHGERIRYEGGKEPRWLDIPQMSPAVIAFLQLLQTYMDERGIAVLSFGKLPSAKLGWRALESLKQIEIGNMQDFVEEIANTLQQLAYKILEIGENAWLTEPYQFLHENKLFRLVSASSPLSLRFGEGIIPISTKWDIKVEIESGLAYTEEGKMEKMLELYKAGLVTADEVRERLKLGPTPVKEVEKVIQKQKGSFINMEQF